MDKKKIKDFIERNKKKIVVGGLIAGGVILSAIGFAAVKKMPRLALNNSLDTLKKGLPNENLGFLFNDGAEAFAKFEELSKNAPEGTIALWNNVNDGHKYLVLVQDLR